MDEDAHPDISQLLVDAEHLWAARSSRSYVTLAFGFDPCRLFLEDPIEENRGF